MCFNLDFVGIIAQRQLYSCIEGNRRHSAVHGRWTSHGAVTLGFSHAFDMVVHGLLLCKLQNAQKYSVGAGMLVVSYIGERAQFVRSGGQESSFGAVTREVLPGSVLVSDFQKCIDGLNLDLQRVHE
jgi:hypothetical protein